MLSRAPLPDPCWRAVCAALSALSFPFGPVRLRRAALFQEAIMADYSTPTVVQPNIPADAIAMLELMVLKQLYDWQREGEHAF